MSATVARRVARRSVLSPAAKPHHDLQAIFSRLNQRYFEGQLLATITWMRRYRPREWERGTIMLGACIIEERRIRIHRALGQRWVPRFFMEWIMFHEMLHLVHDIPIDERGRHHFHTPEFCAHERQFPLHRLAKWWERTHLNRLLSS